jgi:uncharacterized membrane protein YhaH (DUF805 family)
MGGDGALENFSIWHWVIFAIFLIVYLVPIVKILSRAGYSGWWCLLALIPIVNVIGLWVFANARWPALNAARNGQ